MDNGNAAGGEPADKPPVMAAEVLPDAPWSISPPVRWRELVAVIGMVACADVTVYRGAGYTGLAALLVSVSLLLWFGRPGRSIHVAGAVVTTILVWLLAARMVWCGSVLRAMIGGTLVLAIATALSGLAPHLAEVVAFPARMLLGGLRGVADYLRSATRLRSPSVRLPWLSVLLPFVTVIVFSVLFVLANPDLLSGLGDWADRILQSFRTWMFDWLPAGQEVLFWLVVAWIAIGLLRPTGARAVFAELDSADRDTDPPLRMRSTWYAAARNTLVCVILLFAVYLVFEFKTLWFRVFPDGFYYSGYAHQGAAWLTVALALATLVLSLVFRGPALRDPRIRVLRQLAWVWSVQNMLLAAAVYHRLFIYVGFNGWTQMRIVGLFGISSVVCGFLLVLWKMTHNRRFIWLVQRQLWTVAIAVYLFGVTPVDTIVTKLNVRRIMSGDSAPSVQISVHPISAEGIVQLLPLLHCPDAKVREGVRAMLAQRRFEYQQLVATSRAAGWTAYQCADRFVLATLEGCQSDLTRYSAPAAREAALTRFHDYAYQWY